MMDESFVDDPSDSMEEVIGDGQTDLPQLIAALEDLNAQHDTQKEDCAKLRKTISKHEKQSEDLKEDIHVLEELKQKLICIPEFFNNHVEKFNELEVLIRKKRDAYVALKESHNELNETVNQRRENLRILQERLEETKQVLEQNREHLAIYDRWIAVLINRAKVPENNESNAMDVDMGTSSGGFNVSDPEMMEQKGTADYVRGNIDRKITWDDDTLATLDNTKERYATVNASIENVKETINNLEKLISEEIVALEKSESEENAVRTEVEKIEAQWNQYIKMQESLNIMDKLRTTNELLRIYWKEYCDIQQEANVIRNNLFLQSLNLLMVKSNIEFMGIKRDEAQIALRLNGAGDGAGDGSGDGVGDGDGDGDGDFDAQ